MLQCVYIGLVAMMSQSMQSWYACSGAALESSPIIDWPGLAYSNDVLQLQVWIHQWTESDAWL